MRYCGSPNSLNYGQATWREERSSHFSKNLTLHLFGEEERKWPGPKHYHYLSHVDVVFCVFNGSLMCQHFRWKAHFKVACKSRQLICPFFTVACVAPFWVGKEEGIFPFSTAIDLQVTHGWIGGISFLWSFLQKTPWCAACYVEASFIALLAHLNWLFTFFNQWMNPNPLPPNGIATETCDPLWGSHDKNLNSSNY